MRTTAVALSVLPLLLTACGTADDTAAADASAGGSESVAGPADPAEAARTIEIEALDQMAFDPERVEVEAGEVVTFSVTNAGQAVHEFTLGDAAEQEAHADEMGEMDGDMSHDDDPNSITVQPGETAELTWRFGSSGTVQYACHVPGHFEAGMHGEVSVG